MPRKVRVGVVPTVVGGVLTIAYVATLAPDVTLWDSGEFLAAIHSVGIPHPPGTPLYIVIGAGWGRLFGWLMGFARSINLLSAVATTVGCALLGSGVARWTTSRTAGIAAGLAAGGMLSVWRSATETEVYAVSFALALVAFTLGDRAGRMGRWRDAVLALYIVALAVPLHLSALLIAPGVIAFAANDEGRWNVPVAIALSGAAVLAMALGTVSWLLALAGLALLLAGSLTRKDVVVGTRLKHAGAAMIVVLLAATGVFVMYLRARHDPFVNQGNPATFSSLLGVVGREQYDVPPLWPRRAPLWLQIGNLIQYADWQVAFGLDQWVGPSVRRTPFTLLFAFLAVPGAAWHRARDPRSFQACALALASCSLGAIFVLNLRTGPSFGVGVLPEGALHEARERDYFFGLAFAFVAAWAGMGAARVGSWIAARSGKMRLGIAAALGLAALPLALNWRAADRSERDAPLANRFARAILDSAPRDAVLLVAGDNDTYPLWYVQRVEQRRRDVTVVTIPLLPASWYRAELTRRHGLAMEDGWRGVDATIATVGRRAQESKRPLATAVSVPARQRETLGGRWILRGMTYEQLSAEPEQSHGVGITLVGDTVVIVPAAADLWVDTVMTGQSLTPSDSSEIDPTARYVAALLKCPAQILSAVRAQRGSVDPRCNLR